jgi:cell wall-associated NlpC family hydrolase
MKPSVAVAVFLALIFLAIMHSRLNHHSPPPSTLTRAQALATAERYVRHAWTATEANTFHGVDEKGVRVDTPDSAFRTGDSRVGWWKPGAQNVGVPYMWGGFDTPESFDAAMRAGKWAGDISTSEKRRLLDDAVSARCAGIDCSGFVSRCWRLPRSYSTRELQALCDPVKDFSQLKPGDIFNKFNSHVRLFARWADAGRENAQVYEAGDKWRVVQNPRNIASMQAEGYTAWRYRGILD